MLLSWYNRFAHLINNKIMDKKYVISLSEAKENFFEIIDEVQKPDVYYVLTEDGRSKAVVMSAEKFDSWQETLEIMSDPELVKELKESEKEIERGEYVTLEELLEKEGLSITDNPKTTKRKSK